MAYFNWSNFGPDNYPGIVSTSFNLGSTGAVGNNPTIAKNEFLLAMVWIESSAIGTISVAGFTSLYQTNDATAGWSYYVGYKIAGSSETGSYSCTWQNNVGNIQCAWGLASYFGVNISTPVDQSSYTLFDSNQNSFTSIAVTPTNINDMLINIFMSRGGDTVTNQFNGSFGRIIPTTNNNSADYGTIILSDCFLPTTATTNTCIYTATQYAEQAFTATIALNSASVKTIALTSGSSWTVPADWNPNNNIIEAIGGGGGGSSMYGYSGGGGEYARISNFAATIGSSVSINIGQGGQGGVSGGLHYGADGTNTTFGAVLVAVGGSGGNSTAAGGTGGLGTVLNNGGNGWVTGVSSGGSGGGGAGGPGYALVYSTPQYAGGNGGLSNTGSRASNAPAGGGGGGSVFLTGSGTSSNNGGAGANSYDNAGQGGSGGSKSSGGTNGGTGTQWLLFNGSYIGSGGGGGGGGSTGTNGQAGGNGGLYGGGGGSGGNGGGNGAGGNGANGVIVISYIPNPIPVSNGVTFQSLTVQGQ